MSDRRSDPRAPSRARVLTTSPAALGPKSCSRGSSRRRPKDPSVGADCSGSLVLFAPAPILHPPRVRYPLMEAQSPKPEFIPEAVVAEPSAPVVKSDVERKQLLARTLQSQIVAGGRVESQSDFEAVIVSGKRVNH